MSVHFADRLTEAIREKGAPVCVGLDPVLERLPRGLLREFNFPLASRDASWSAEDRRVSELFLAFGRSLIQAAAPHVPAIKINIAFFERYHADGVRAYYALVRVAREAGLIVIGDVKRADIGHSSTAYAEAQLRGGAATSDETALTPDAVTVNPYFGSEAIRPFIEIAREEGRGLFVLVQTSNDSAFEVQGVVLRDGSTLSDHVAQLVHGWADGEGLIGCCQYSCVGAVVSPRDVPSTERLRRLMPHCLFLVPGFGAQGRTIDEVAKCFKPDGSGALVTASRSVAFAYEDARYTSTFGDDWPRCIAQACREFRDAIRSVVSA